MTEEIQEVLDDVKRAIGVLSDYIDDLRSYQGDVEFYMDRLVALIEVDELQNVAQPLPKYDICICVRQANYMIRCANTRAKKWMDEEAPKFGTYTYMDGYNWLFIYPEYNEEEVIRYLCGTSFRSQIVEAGHKSKLKNLDGALNIDYRMNQTDSDYFMGAGIKN